MDGMLRSDERMFASWLMDDDVPPPKSVGIDESDPSALMHDVKNHLQCALAAFDIIHRTLCVADGAATDAIFKAGRQSLVKAAEMATGYCRSDMSPDVGLPVRIDDVLEDMLPSLRVVCGPAITFSYRHVADNVRIDCAVQDLESAVLNLVINARDAMPQGGAICLGLSEVRGSLLGNAPHACLSVRDTGMGMTAAHLDKAQQGGFTTKADGLGSGLGLLSIQRFVATVGGHIEIDSRVSAGTEVCLYLPVSRDVKTA